MSTTAVVASSSSSTSPRRSPTASSSPAAAAVSSMPQLMETNNSNHSSSAPSGSNGANTSENEEPQKTDGNNTKGATFDVLGVNNNSNNNRSSNSNNNNSDSSPVETSIRPLATSAAAAAATEATTTAASSSREGQAEEKKTQQQAQSSKQQQPVVSNISPTSNPISNGPTTNTGAATTTCTTSAAATTTTSQETPPLPPDLRRILVEVAQTGTSSTLSWNGIIPTRRYRHRSSNTNHHDASLASGLGGGGSLTGGRSYSGNKHARSSTSGLSGRPNTKTTTHRPRPLYATATSSPRKKHRNGLHVRQKHSQKRSSSTTSTSRSSHKRPLLLIRTNSNPTTIAAAAPAAGAVNASGGSSLGGAAGLAGGNPSQHFSLASGRTSGSEPEDTSQYDSEGTTTTTNSEMSFEHTRRSDASLRGSNSSVRGGVGGANSMGQAGASSANSRLEAGQDGELGGGNQSSDDASAAKRDKSLPAYPSLKEAFRTALGLVLDHWHKNRGGYKLSPAEIRRTTGVVMEASSTSNNSKKPPPGEAGTSAESQNSNDSISNDNATGKKENEGSNENGNCVTVNGNAPPKSATATPVEPSSDDNKKKEMTESSAIAQEIFRQRRNFLLNMIYKPTSQAQAQAQAPQEQALEEGAKMPAQQQTQPLLQNNHDDVGPPFTIQRIAEVLIAPERYYTQTHKLCNCLEKLLLVKSPTTAFGGSRGGDTSQSRREERELAALADERGRLKYEYRHRRLRRRASSLSDGENPTETNIESSTSAAGSRHGHPVEHEIRSSKESSMELSESKSLGTEDVVMGERDAENDDDLENAVGSTGSSALLPEEEAMNKTKSGDDVTINTKSDEQKREELEAAARASLRTKFDHVGIDPHSSTAVANRDVRAIAESRGMTNSPPPPSLPMAAVLPGHGGLFAHGGDHSPEHHPKSLVRPQSPILFHSGSGEVSSPPTPRSPPSAHHASPNIQLLQMHHAAAVAGVSPLDLVGLGGGGGHAGTSSSAAAAYANGGVSEMSSASAALAMSSGLKESDLESRSSASSDGIDSESDDVSFDDSASDRSDGSDSGHNYEPGFSAAARAMALNRMQQQQQQQQRLQQSRLLTSLGSSPHYHQQQQQAQTGGGAVAPGTSASGLSEFQSGDFMESSRAEDSGGSDSSSSDAAD